ncbi:hypothetical protein MARCHEWKA_05650 [Brevundimonas phage vB_BpoS-Marchewka]|uniref:Pre-tape measure chaperone protein n=1 Tax=Brevundimonas phage vB_BpoS-Marchewka TaxID=2948604 RepID=A0A9E7SRD5_9CAUD|nr:hypothetical protein MARCHEWKA_05650 [Brevundimonas phage vB_BpoS-Marchewka]UTC29514.1 hypothetical protein BAMBUS_04350 [Brevundimonas phage vB_BpoS-Bambus]
MSDALNLFDIFASNKESEEHGRWVELGSGTAFKIRAFGAKVVSDLRDDLMKPYAQLVRVGSKIPEDKNEEIGLRVLAGAVIADWKNVKNAAGDIVPYTADEAYAILKALPKMANFVIQFSLEAQNFKDEAREGGVGNS